MVIAAAAVACGLDLTGVAPIGTSDAGVDASSTRDVTPEPPVEGGKDPETGPPDADMPDTGCDAGAGAFCDHCNPELVLCVQFEGGIVDQSMYRRNIELDGAAPSFVAEDGGEAAISLDGSTTFHVLDAPELSDNRQFTVEVWAKLRALPPDGGRYGLFDRQGVASEFLYGGGQVDASTDKPHLRCSNIDSQAIAFPTDKYLYFACVANHDKSTIRGYVDGKRVINEADGGGVLLPYFPDGGWHEPLVLFANSPSLDDFQGEVASIRVFTHVRTAADVAATAGRDAGKKDASADAGDDDDD